MASHPLVGPATVEEAFSYPLMNQETKFAGVLVALSYRHIGQSLLGEVLGRK